MKVSGDFVIANITHDMVGEKAIIPTNDVVNDELARFHQGEVVHGEIRTIPDSRLRSNAQNNLYWAACTYVAKHKDDFSWNDKEKVSEQVKIALRFVECYYYYRNEKTGKEELNIKTRSISFTSLEHADAQKFFDDAFAVLAGYMDMETDHFIAAVMDSMGCEGIDALGIEDPGQIKFDDLPGVE